jgi:hypothetical protein
MKFKKQGIVSILGVTVPAEFRLSADRNLLKIRLSSGTQSELETVS